MGHLVQFVDSIRDLMEEAHNCNLPIPVGKSVEMLERLIDGFLEEPDHPLSVIRMNLGDGIVFALLNSILGSFAGSLIVSAKNMTKEEAEKLLDSLDGEVGKA